MNGWINGWMGGEGRGWRGMDGSIYEHQCQQQLDDPAELAKRRDALINNKIKIL